jgi:hypothetical protein
MAMMSEKKQLCMTMVKPNLYQEKKKEPKQPERTFYIIGLDQMEFY